MTVDVAAERDPRTGARGASPGMNGDVAAERDQAAGPVPVGS